MIKTTHILIVLMLVLLGTQSCEKVEKVGPNNFTNKSSWQVTELSIDGDKMSVLPSWEIKSEGCSVWCHDGGTCTNFYWLFSNGNKRFQFYVDTWDPENKINSAYKQCDNFAGEYLVLTSKKDQFEFESHETNGYIGPRIFIRIE